MVRVYIADLKVQQKLNKLFKENDKEFTNFGLVIGQFSENKDYIVHIVQTPLLEGTATSNASLEKTLAQSLLTHCRQVRQLLIGGIDILGMVVYEDAAQFKSAISKYKQLLYNSYKVVGKFDSFTKMPQMHNDRILLHIDSASKKLSCRSYNILDNKSTGNPGELKFQRVCDCFLSISTELYVKRVIYVCRDDAHSSLELTLDNGLIQELNDIRDSDVMMNEELIEIDEVDDLEDDYVDKKDKETLQMSMEALMASRSVMPKAATSHFVVNLVLNTSKNTEQPLESAQVKRCGARILVHGMMACKAFVHHKVSLREAVKMLKLDVMRSLLTRCEFVCQDLITSEEDQTDIQLVYESPIRVFASLYHCAEGQSGLQFCDYLFQEETTEDSRNRLCDVLGLQAGETCIVRTDETFPDSEKLENEGDMCEMLSGGFSKQQLLFNEYLPAIDLFKDRFKVSKSTQCFNLNKYFLMGGGIVMAAAAVVIGCYYSAKSQVQQMLHSHDQSS